jgi:two-component system, cell cycle response regulator DivK
MNEQESILLIDDDSRNIFALTAVLKAKGYHVISATSAQEGITALRQNKDIKVVLMDMMMPDMDGYEAIGIIKNDAALKEKKVIAVTAQAMVGDREKCLQAGADDYVSKPVDVDLLLHLLQANNSVDNDQR